MLRHFIESSDFNEREYDDLFRLAADIAKNPSPASAKSAGLSVTSKEP